jgi:hypothetical protein
MKINNLLIEKLTNYCYINRVFLINFVGIKKKYIFENSILFLIKTQFYEKINFIFFTFKFNF